MPFTMKATQVNRKLLEGEIGEGLTANTEVITIILKVL